MPEYNAFSSNFTGGEWGKHLSSRFDLAKYNDAYEVLQNVVSIPQGPAKRRPATRYVAEVKDSSEDTRIVRFQFSTTQAYIIEFGDQYIRFCMNEGQILSGPTPYEVATPYLEAELFELQFAQSADTLYVAHPNHAPRKITRTGHTAWTVTSITFTSNPFTGAGDYPAAVALYEERSVWAGTDNDPQKIFFSKSGDFEDMTVGTSADDAMTYTIASDEVNAIKWLSPGDYLLVGTTGGEFHVSGATATEAITPTSIQVNRRTRYGSNHIYPIRHGSQVVFAQKTGRKIREYLYNDSIGAYEGNDMTIFNDRILGGGLVSMDMQFEPYPVVWCATSGGALKSITYEHAQQIGAWNSHVIGGTDVAVKSVAVIPSPNEDHDQLWMVVERTIDGGTVKYIEFMEEYWNGEEDDIEDAFFVDSGLTYDGSPVTSLSGLDHLEGETVTILADGGVHTTQVVSSGSIDLDRSSSVVHVGLHAPAAFQTLKMAPYGQGIPVSSAWTRINKVFIRLIETIGLEVGTSESEYDAIPFRDVNDLMDTPVPVYDGLLEVEFDGDWGFDDMVIYGVQNLPLPCTFGSIHYRTSVNK